MRIPWKLASIVAIMVIPILYGVVTIYQYDTEIIEKDFREQEAVEYLVAVGDVLEHIPLHRGEAAELLAGDLSVQQELQQLRADIDSEFENLEAVDQRLNADLQSTEFLTPIVQSWRDLRTGYQTMTEEESFDRHSEIVDSLIGLLQHVALTGDLIDDPEIESSVLITLIVNDLPQTIEDVAQLRDYGAAVATHGSRTLEERTHMGDLINSIERGDRIIERLIEDAFKVTEHLEADLGPLLSASIEGVKSFISLADRELIQPEVMTIAPHEYFAQGTETVTRLIELYKESLAELNGLLVVREQKARNQRTLAIVIASVLTLMAGLVAVWVGRGITNQVASVTGLFGQIGLGDFEARAPVLSNDELGDLTSNLNTMLDNTLSLMQSQQERDQIQQSIQKLMMEIADAADGDLTVEAEVTTEVTGAIADSFNFLVVELRQVISRVKDTTLQVSSAASEIQATTEHLAQGSESQADQIVNTTSAVDEMAASINQVSDNASSAAAVAQQALTNAKQGNSAVERTITGMGGIRQQVQETAKRMKRLGESSQEVGEIVQLIGDIADRTSILALNASIQAAMAGEAGRGFAVVAEEVERLAERSAEATKRIEGLIKTIQIETSEAVGAMEETTREVVAGSSVANEAGSALQEIEGVSVRLAELIGAISQSAKQQARGSESVARSMGEISEVTQQTAAGTQQAAVSISNLAELADDLRESVSTFKLPESAA